MKKLILVLAVMFIGVSGYGQGITFDHSSSWSELMAKAKAENKVIFVDFHTEWCGPCKQMAATTFMDENVGEIFNKRFINAKIDAEKGEGVELAKKYEIKAYPTMLFIDAQGQIIHRIVGGKDVTGIMAELKKLDVFMQEGSIQSMDEKFKSGNRDLDFMQKYYAMCDDSQKGEVLVAYLMAMPDSILFNANNKLLEEIPVFNKELHTRLIDGLVIRNSTNEEFNFCVTFPIQYGFSKLLQAAVDNGDEKLMNEVLLLKAKATTLNNAIDDDVDIQWGRGLFFVSDDLIHLLYNFANTSDVDAKKAQIKSYMTDLMAKYKATDPLAERDSLNKNYGSFAAHVIARYNENNHDITTYMNTWVDFYWRKSPNDKATKNLCAEWAKYIYQHYCFNAKGAIVSSEMLLRLDKKKDALTVLETAATIFAPAKVVDEFNPKQDSPSYLMLMERIEDVKNDKF